MPNYRLLRSGFTLSGEFTNGVPSKAILIEDDPPHIIGPVPGCRMCTDESLFRDDVNIHYPLDDWIHEVRRGKQEKSPVKTTVTEEMQPVNKPPPLHPCYRAYPWQQRYLQQYASVLRPSASKQTCPNESRLPPKAATSSLPSPQSANDGAMENKQQHAAEAIDLANVGENLENKQQQATDEAIKSKGEKTKTVKRKLKQPEAKPVVRYVSKTVPCPWCDDWFETEHQCRLHNRKNHPRSDY